MNISRQSFDIILPLAARRLSCAAVLADMIDAAHAEAIEWDAVYLSDDSTDDLADELIYSTNQRRNHAIRDELDRRYIAERVAIVTNEYVRMVRAIGPSFHPDTDPTTYSLLHTTGYTPYEVEVILSYASSYAEIDVYALALAVHTTEHRDALTAALATAAVDAAEAQRTECAATIARADAFLTRAAEAIDRFEEKSRRQTFDRFAEYKLITDALQAPIIEAAHAEAIEEDESADTIEHRITVDEDGADESGAMFKAFCTDECGWSGKRWHHADEYADSEDVPPADRACAAAEVEGADHLTDLNN